MKTSREKDIIISAADMEEDESMFIRCETKKEQQKQFTVYHNLARDYTANIEPDITLIVGKTFQDKRLWIKITKRLTINQIFIKKKDGTVVRATIKEDTENNL